MEKIGENEKTIFYTDRFCELEDKHYKIIIAELKINQYKTYILLHKNKPIYENQNLESVFYRQNIHKLIRNKKD